ncbi:hypothetical protein E2562_002515 [Oryza meyeriana var. granulata]|uniref:Uncharacterized protein n=1 Tax=Oryza meyeriana var. granulata TaxID=110450 RepID=A0A6G1F2M5_9ORYZ|nr:hypothetical protein E2562_002515 [Oryza meyeriana var. granulata]
MYTCRLCNEHRISNMAMRPSASRPPRRRACCSGKIIDIRAARIQDKDDDEYLQCGADEYLPAVDLKSVGIRVPPRRIALLSHGGSN